jgi:hypothetical protein
MAALAPWTGSRHGPGMDTDVRFIFMTIRVKFYVLSTHHLMMVVQEQGAVPILSAQGIT